MLTWIGRSLTRPNDQWRISLDDTLRVCDGLPMTFGIEPGDIKTVEIARGALRATLLNYGARLTQLWVPDRDGALADIVLGHDDVQGYLSADKYFGATCGRFANRIAGGRFVLNGRDYSLDRNEGDNHLHGGAFGFDKKIWALTESSGEHAVFTATSKDREMGYPGTCHLTCTYRFHGDHGLTILMEAESDAPTPINMVHHSYFNLAGGGDVLAQEVRIHGDHYLVVGPGLIPTGQIAEVAETAFDFRRLRLIGARLHEVAKGKGYDHNWCLVRGSGSVWPAAEARDPVSGRTMTLRTNQPGLQFYAGGYLSSEITAKGGVPLGPFAGFTLETQAYPDAPNHPDFPDAILQPGAKYQHIMEFEFAAK